jgi:hypothetical protein
MLALVYQDANKTWKTDHSVRRFVRPVLMRDPQVVLDNGEKLCPGDAQAPVDPAAPAIT